MLARVRAKRPEARIEGFLVQRQAARALELRLRLGDDAMFGPWIGFGQGGTAADLAEDEAHDLPPLNLALAGAADRPLAHLAPDGRLPRPCAGEPGGGGGCAGAPVADRGGFPGDRGADDQPAVRRQRRRAGGRRAPGAAAGGRVRRPGHPALSGGAGTALADEVGRGADDPPGPPGGCRDAWRVLPHPGAGGCPLALLLAAEGVVADA